jgi:hypothetical protein
VKIEKIISFPCSYPTNTNQVHPPVFKNNINLDSVSERMRIAALGGVVSKTGRVFGQLAVSRSLGDVHMKALRSGAEYVSNDPYLAKFTLSPRDKFLVIACDGLWDELSYQDAVGTILSRHLTPSILHPSSIHPPSILHPPSRIFLVYLLTSY